MEIILAKLCDIKILLRFSINRTVVGASESICTGCCNSEVLSQLNYILRRFSQVCRE